MGLFAPWFLAGVAAVGLPIYLHLLRRHSTTPRPFSSLMFFEPRTQSSIRHRRLRYLLLLSLRMALLVLLALAFANPFITRSGRAHAGRQARPAGDRRLVQHARGHSDERRQARGAVRAGVPPIRRIRCRSWRSTRNCTSLTPQTRDSATARAAVDSRSGRRLPQQLRRAGARRASGERRGPRVDRAAPVQRHAAVEHGADVRGNDVSRHRHARPSSGGQSRDAELDGRKRHRSRPALGLATRRQARARAGRHRRLRHAGGHANGIAVRERQDRSRPGPCKCPQAGAPPSSSRRSTCRTASAAARSDIDSADAFPNDDGYLFAVERSDPQRGACSFMRPPMRARRATSATRWPRRPNRRSSCSRSRSSRPRTSPCRSTASSCSRISSVCRRRSRTVCCGYVRDGGSVLVALGTAAAGRGRVPIFGETIQARARLLARIVQRSRSVSDRWAKPIDRTRRSGRPAACPA